MNRAKVLNTAEIAARTGLSRRRINQRAGEIPGRILEGRWGRFRCSDELDQWIATNTVKESARGLRGRKPLGSYVRGKGLRGGRFEAMLGQLREAAQQLSRDLGSRSEFEKKRILTALRPLSGFLEDARIDALTRQRQREGLPRHKTATGTQAESRRKLQLKRPFRPGMTLGEIYSEAP
jgi:hypothetical protein